MTSRKVNEEFFLVWESSCRNFIDEVCFASEDAKKRRLKVHVFLRKDTPAEAMPPSEQQNEWIKHHVSLTSCPYASETALVSYTIQTFSTSVFDSKTLPNRIYYLVSERERQYDELAAVLKASRGCRGRLDVCQVDGSTQSIYDVVNDACKFCKLVFLDEEEFEEHNLKMHDYFCNNLTECLRGMFYTKEALWTHQAAQTSCTSCKGKVFCTQAERQEHFKSVHDINDMERNDRMKPPGVRKMQSETQAKFRCKFCPAKSFSSSEQQEVHMKHSHKKCNCSCGQYFETRDDYLKHFYSIYPLSCFENRKCPRRFQSVLYQADHHKESHNSLQPYYCVPCYRRKLEEGEKLRVSFKDEKSLRIHGMSLGHNEDELFMSGQTDSLKVDAPDQRRAPSRTCSAINFC